MTLSTSRPSNYRQVEIVALLRQSGRVTVEDLAVQFGVTLQTIRRDLKELSEARSLVRVHGGAIIASGVSNLAYEARQHVAHTQKQLIGEAAARLVPTTPRYSSTSAPPPKKSPKGSLIIPDCW